MSSLKCWVAVVILVLYPGRLRREICIGSERPAKAAVSIDGTQKRFSISARNTRLVEEQRGADASASLRLFVDS